MTTQHTVPGQDRIDLVEGPGKFELSTALFTRMPGRATVEFFSPFSAYVARINSVEVEDGSGNCWNITGTAHEKTAARLKIWKRFKGFYRTGGPGGKGGFIQFLE